MTRFGEPIHSGVIAPTEDGSVDELLASRALVRDGRIIPGPGARTVIVVETPAGAVPLAKRVAAHAAILRALPRWRANEEPAFQRGVVMVCVLVAPVLRRAFSLRGRCIIKKIGSGYEPREDGIP